MTFHNKFINPCTMVPHAIKANDISSYKNCKFNSNYFSMYYTGIDNIDNINRIF